MVQSPDRYSRWVSIARIGFPVIALILIVSVFLFSKSDALRDGLLITDEEMIALATGQKITNANFAGVTVGGDAFTVTADEALPDAPRPKRVYLVEPIVKINTKEGRDIRSESRNGRLDIEKNLATQMQDVVITTDDGYRATSDFVTIMLDSGNAISPGPVNATGPIGSIEAGRFEAIQNLQDNPDGGRTVLLFQRGVKVIYRPQDNRGDE